MKKQHDEQWEREHKEQLKLYRYRSNAKSFIRNWANSKDLDDLEVLIDEKRKKLNVEQLLGYVDTADENDLKAMETIIAKRKKALQNESTDSAEQ